MSKCRECRRRLLPYELMVCAECYARPKEKSYNQRVIELLAGEQDMTHSQSQPANAREALAQIDALISNSERPTVTAGTALEHFDRLNRLLMQIRDIARAPQPKCGVRTYQPEIDQQNAQLEGLAIGLEQRGEKSAAHLIRLTLKRLQQCGVQTEPVAWFSGDAESGFHQIAKQFEGQEGTFPLYASVPQAGVQTVDAIQKIIADDAANSSHPRQICVGNCLLPAIKAALAMPSADRGTPAVITNKGRATAQRFDDDDPSLPSTEREYCPHGERAYCPICR